MASNSFAFFTILILGIFPCIFGDTVYIESSDYSSGALGYGPDQTFQSSSYTPAAWNFIVPINGTMHLEEGYIFLAPRGASTSQLGPVIYDQTGSLVWDGSDYGVTMSFTVVTYHGEPHILVWQGNFSAAGFGSGFDLLINQNYEIVANYTAAGLNGTYADFHEADLTSNGTGILDAYQTISLDLTTWGGSENGWLFDSVAQEINITSDNIPLGEAIWTWKAIEHVDPSDCYSPLSTYGVTEDNPWDYFHINSIEKDNNSSYLISSRHCSTLFYVNSTGDIQWRMGGRNSSFSMGNGTNFSWQHYSRWVNDDHTLLSVFDNGGTNLIQNESYSRALILSVDYDNMTVQLEHEFLPYNQTISQSQGSIHKQTGGNVIVGWGQIPWFGEYTADGELLWTVQYGVGDVQGYRALRYNWTGTPSATSPSLVVGPSTDSDGSSVVVYASWNGATEISYWTILGSNSSDGDSYVSLMNVTKSGFESSANVTTNNVYFGVQAWSSSDELLGNSDTFTTVNSSIDSTATENHSIQLQQRHVLFLLAVTLTSLLQTIY